MEIGSILTPDVMIMIAIRKQSISKKMCNGQSLSHLEANVWWMNKMERMLMWTLYWSWIKWGWEYKQSVEVSATSLYQCTNSSRIRGSHGDSLSHDRKLKSTTSEGGKDERGDEYEEVVKVKRRMRDLIPIFAFFFFLWIMRNRMLREETDPQRIVSPSLFLHHKYDSWFTSCLITTKITTRTLFGTRKWRTKGRKRGFLSLPLILNSSGNEWVKEER